MPKGRRFAVWHFTLGPQSVEIECRTEDTYSEGIRFFVHDDRFELHMEDPSPNALKQRVHDHLKNVVVQKWEYFMVVEVSALRDSDDADELEADKISKLISPYLSTDPKLPEERRYFSINQTIGMRIEIEAWRKTAIGEKVRYERYGFNGWTDAMGDYDARPANVGTDEDLAGSRSVLPITEENLAALRNIVTSFHQLRGLLAEVLSPRRIETTLAGAVNFLPRLPELPALPAPAKPKKRKS